MNKKHERLEFKTITNVPMSDESILNNEPFVYSLGGHRYRIEQFTYRDYLDFNGRLHLGGVAMLSFPDDTKYNEHKRDIFKYLSAKNSSLLLMIDLITDYSHDEKSKLPRWWIKQKLKKSLKVNLYLNDLITLFEQVLRFNWQIKKKLLELMKNDPREAGQQDSEILQGLCKEHLDLAKDGILIPRF